MMVALAPALAGALVMRRMVVPNWGSTKLSFHAGFASGVMGWGALSPCTSPPQRSAAPAGTANKDKIKIDRTFLGYIGPSSLSAGFRDSSFGLLIIMVHPAFL